MQKLGRTSKSVKTEQLFGSKGGSHPLGRFTDQSETYGPLVVERLIGSLSVLRMVVDLGAGSGRDLAIVRRLHPKATLIAMECDKERTGDLVGKADKVVIANLERDRLPLEDRQGDLIMANQVLEHMKEVFWIFHEVSRSLKVGRVLLIWGAKSLFAAQPVVAAVRQTADATQGVFGARSAVFRERYCGVPGGVLPWRLRTSILPRLAVLSLPFADGAAARRLFPDFRLHYFFMIRKKKEYGGGFAAYPARAHLETNYWSGDVPALPQY